jgi:hypothetical protein
MSLIKGSTEQGWYNRNVDPQMHDKELEMADQKFDPLALMWTDPITVYGLWESLPEEEQEMAAKCLVPVANGLNRSFDAVMGKDNHPLARMAIIMALNVQNQTDILRQAGFEVDELGSPVEDETNPDERPEDEGDLEDIPDDND